MWALFGNWNRMTTTFKEHACPWCKRLNDAVTASEQNKGTKIPEPGDMAICYGCRNLLVFTDEGARRATPEEQNDAMKEPNVRDALEALRRGMRPTVASQYKSS
jgi:glutaredoxin